MSISKIVWWAVILSLAGCITTDGNRRPPALTGRIYYTVEVPLPAGSAIDLVLLDTRRTADPADDRIVARHRIPKPDYLPIRYRLPFDPEAIDTDSLHRIEARVYINDKLVFDTRGIVPALTRRSGLTVDIPLDQPDNPALGKDNGP
ncbi:MAG: YbaY family lipoprotein [Opitutales bacterium]